MAADWMFDDGGIDDDLDLFARHAGEALLAARAALKSCCGGLATAGDRRILQTAAAQVTDVRRRLRDLDRDLLADAESLLEEALEQGETAELRLVSQET